MDNIKGSGEEQQNAEDLDSLLDSALDDFQKPVSDAVLTAVAPHQQASPSTSGGFANDEKKATDVASGDQWAADYKNFQDVMQSLLNADPNAFGDLGLGGENGEDFASSLAETLKSISEGTQSFPEPSPEELAQLLNSMGVDDASKGDSSGNDHLPDVMPLMQNVMQSLLSKELLYPALKDFVNKYPEWLESKKDSLEESEFGKYTTQYDLMKQVCEEFEREFDDTEEEKLKSFQKILMLMQKMKDCGDPPKELIGDMSPELAAFDPTKASLPGMPEQCTIM